ncbi:MAG: energy transducer TonB [Bacteroidota bacterium]
MDKKNIGRKELEDYLKGDLSNQDSHELEKDALESEFESDALEGLEHTKASDFSSSMEDLDGRLSRRIEQKKKGIDWYLLAGIAASVLIVVTTVFYVQNRNTINNQLSEAPLIETEKDDDSKNELAYEYSEAETEEEIEKEEEIKELELTESESKSLQAVEEKPKELPKTNKNQTLAYNATEKKQEAEEQIVAIDLSVQEEDVVEEEEITEVVFEEVVSSELAEVVADERRPIQTSALSTNEQAAGASQSFARAKSKETTPRAKKASVFGDREPAPINGFDALKEYIAKNKKAKQVGEGDYAVISFDVKDDSKLTNFKVLEETKEDLGKEAIRLIKKGPNWFPAIQEGVAVKKEVELKIDF